MPLGFDLEHSKPVLLVEESDPFDQAREAFDVLGWRLALQFDHFVRGLGIVARGGWGVKELPEGIFQFLILTKRPTEFVNNQRRTNSQSESRRGTFDGKDHRQDTCSKGNGSSHHVE